MNGAWQVSYKESTMMVAVLDSAAPSPGGASSTELSSNCCVASPGAAEAQECV